MVPLSTPSSSASDVRAVDPVAAGYERQAMPRAAAAVLHVDFPSPRRVGSRRRGRSLRDRLRRASQHIGNPTPGEYLIAFPNRGRTRRERGAISGGVRHDARLARYQLVLDLARRDANPLRIPFNDHCRIGAGALGLLHAGRDAWHARDLIADLLQPGLPLLEIGVEAAAGEDLDRREHADDLLLADFHHAAERVMRRAVHERRPDEVLPAEQQPRALRAAQRLAAAVGDEIGAAREIGVRSRSGAPRPRRQ